MSTKENKAFIPQVNEPCHGYTGGVSAHDGHVTPNPKVFVIYWDPYFTSTPAAVNSMNQFVSDLTVGNYINGLAQYGVFPGALLGSTVINMTKYPAPRTRPLTEDELQSQLVAWLNDGIVSPVPTVNEANKVYLIIAPSVTTLSLNGKTTGFCGYHRHGKYNSGVSTNDNLFWAVVQGYTQSSDGPTFVNSISFCVSHELAETFSNRDGQGYFAPVSNQTCEIGDICEVNSSGNILTVPYLGWQVEQYWSQADQKCISPLNLQDDLGGEQLTSAPAVVSRSSNSMDVFYRGPNNHLWLSTWDGSFFSAPIDLGGDDLASGPGSVKVNSNRIDIFYQGPNNHLWTSLWEADSGWGAPADLAGVDLTSEPAAVSLKPNHVNVFYRGFNNHLWLSQR
jgi:hypothetical protein